MKYKKLEKLEAIRGFCALYVMLFHLLPQKIFLLGINVGFLFRFGSEAVIMFFILSGFVIKYSWEKSEDKSFKNYFLKRFMRIYIPLFFIFLLAYVIKSYTEGGFVNPEWSTLFGNIFMLQDIISQKPNVISPVYMGNGVLWSLSYEWWFYMLFFVLTKKIKPSKRGEIEIVDLLNEYKKRNMLYADFIGRGGAWLDTGSIEDFYKTTAFVSSIENRQGFKIACLEEIAYNYSWINKSHLKNSIRFYGNCDYSKYLSIEMRKPHKYIKKVIERSILFVKENYKV
jgi:hypothetical protein